MIKSSFKAADVIIDKDHEVGKIRFLFLDQIKNKNGKLLYKEVLKDNSGRIYFFDLNKKISK